MTATRAVQSPENDPSNPSTTSAPSGIARPGSAQASQAPSGSHASSSATHWPKRYRLNAFSLILGGKVARSASACRKSCNAGLATAQAASSSSAQPAGAANSAK
jgi:hypothetical protein